MDKEKRSKKDRVMDDNKTSEWKNTTVKQVGLTVKQVRLIFGSKDLTRLQSDMNQELLALRLAHNRIESIRTYPVVELNTVRYIGEIIYSMSYLYKVPKEDTSENK